MIETDVDVLIVGAGPVGLTAALLLQRLGLTITIVDQREGPQRAPAAHVVNARTFEVWRQIGLDLDRILAMAKDPADAGAVHWVTKLGGELLGSLPFERQGDELYALTPTPLRNLSQHKLEPLLRDELACVGVQVRYDHRWVSAVQDDQEVRSSVAADGVTTNVTSRWVLACDGAGSPVRRWLGIEPIGPRSLQSFVMVHLDADFRTIVVTGFRERLRAIDATTLVFQMYGLRLLRVQLSSKAQCHLSQWITARAFIFSATQ